MPFPLTPSQERTLDLTAHLSVTANAGAGKTTVLARRFVEIFMRTATPLGGVVAVTFTEQAAGELRKKIHDVIVGIERDPVADPVVRARLREVRNQLPSAVIGTIHSFCARILRMYPAEAEIDASFSVIQGQERARLVRESIAGAFAESLGEDATAPPAEEFRDLARLVPPARIESYLHSMFARRELMYRLLSTPGCRQTLSERRMGIWRDEIFRDLDARAERAGWARCAAELAAAATGKGREEVGALLGDLARATDPRTRVGIIAAISRAVFTTEGKFRKKFTGPEPGFPETSPAASVLLEFQRKFGRVLGSAGGDAADGPHARAASTLLRTFVRAEEGYTRRKEELGMLDFEDLQIKTLELLGHTAVLSRIRSEYRFFLVDEFQDTNALQYSILKTLLGDFGSGNVFIVGDPKQSIYGFRNADAEIFAAAASDISSPGAGGGSLLLAESFRPLPEIAAFVNFLFSRLMGEGGGPGEVRYDRLVVGREGADVKGSVELLLPLESGDDTPDAESAMIARRIGELARAGGSEGYRYGHCAVLLRDRRNLPSVEKAFEQAGVPYLLSGGVGFFQTQEIFDFLNYITFLLSADDDPALAGILRSPFFGISDAELYEVSLGRGLSLWEKFRAAAGPGAPSSFRRAESVLSAHRSLADRIPVPRLLRRIARDTGWLGTMAGLSHGPQRRENFLKLLDLARERDSPGPVSLWDFREFLEHHSSAEEREAQAATTTGSDVVRVMTVHAAKGLEFPVVALPFLDRKFRGDSEPFLDPVFGVGFSVNDPAGGKGDPGPVAPYLRAISDEKRIAEEKRIFYVACTRARDILLLSGRPAAGEVPPGPGSSPMDWVLGALPPGTGIPGPGPLPLGEIELECLSRGGGKHSTTTRRMTATLVVRSGEDGEEAAAAGARSAPRPEASRFLTAPVPDLSGGETYSATQVRSYLECPARYYLTYVVGMGDGAGRPGGAPGEGHTADRDDERELAGLEGTLTHRLLSEVDSGTTRPVLEERFPGLYRSVSAPGSGDAGDELRERVIGHVTAFLASGAGRRILTLGGAKAEFGIFATFDDAILTGILDRVYAAEDGRMEFVDYKTDSVSGGELEDRARTYRTQMAVYALLIRRFYGQETVTGRLIFLKSDCREVVFTFSAADLAEFSDRIREAIGGIRRREFTSPVETCHGCPYREGKRCRVVPGVV